MLIEELIDRPSRIEKFTEAISQYPVIDPEYMDDFVRWLSENGYFDAPASANYHGTNVGDLFRHSLAVAETLDGYTKCLGLNWQRRWSPWIVGMFHDLCKMDQYILNTGTGLFTDGEEFRRLSESPMGWKWNDKQLIIGHGDKSVMLLSRFLNLTEEEILCIRYHMGAYNKEDWNGFDLAIRKFPNVLYTHMADMYASKVMDI